MPVLLAIIAADDALLECDGCGAETSVAVDRAPLAVFVFEWIRWFGKSRFTAERSFMRVSRKGKKRSTNLRRGTRLSDDLVYSPLEFAATAQRYSDVAKEHVEATWDVLPSKELMMNGGRK